MKRYKNNRLFNNLHFFMNEAVIHTEKYLAVISEELKKLRPNVFNTSEEVCEYLTDYLRSYNIIFEVSEENKPSRKGIIRGRIKNNISLDIIIFCASDLKNFYKDVWGMSGCIETILLVLSHELVHRGQYLQMKKHLHVSSDLEIEEGDKNYYKQKDEIMSFANMIIQELRFKGYNNKNIISGIKDGLFDIQDSEFLALYLYNFKDDKKIINQLYKYIYEYLEGDIKIEL